MRSKGELERAIEALGWELRDSKRTPSGWKATIRRGDVSILRAGATVEEVLEGLLEDAARRTRMEEA